MNNINFNNKRFVLLENSATGEVNTETIFEYKQSGNLVTADYSGGTVAYGKIIAYLRNNELEMLYQCLTNDNQLKAGKAIAKVSFSENQKLILKLNWEWITGNLSSGNSEYIEV